LTQFERRRSCFEKLGEATGTQPKSLIRMFGPRGNPQAKNLFSVLGYLQKQAGGELHVTPAGVSGAVLLETHTPKTFSFRLCSLAA
jgi:hypothetical protein